MILARQVYLFKVGDYDLRPKTSCRYNRWCWYVLVMVVSLAWNVELVFSKLRPSFIGLRNNDGEGIGPEERLEDERLLGGPRPSSHHERNMHQCNWNLLEWRWAYFLEPHVRTIP